MVFYITFQMTLSYEWVYKYCHLNLHPCNEILTKIGIFCILLYMEWNVGMDA